MELIVGVNAYSSVEEADAYFETRLEASTWSAATPEAKVQALLTATRIIDDRDWLGVVTDESQTLAFPRGGVYHEPRYNRSVSLGTVPRRIVEAVYETALHLLRESDALETSPSPVDLSIAGAVQLSGIRSTPVIPSLARALIRPLTRQGGASWWRAN